MIPTWRCFYSRTKGIRGEWRVPCIKQVVAGIGSREEGREQGGGWRGACGADASGRRRVVLLDRRLPFRVAPRWRRRVVLGVFGVGGRRRGDGCAQQEGQEHADEQRWQGGRSRHRVEGKWPFAALRVDGCSNHFYSRYGCSLLDHIVPPPCV